MSLMGAGAPSGSGAVPHKCGDMLIVRIWSKEHQAYWRPESHGYTTETHDAGRYEAEDALARTEHCGPEKQILIEWDHDAKFLPRDEFKQWYREKYAATRGFMYPAPSRPELDQLIRQARDHVMTPEELFEQRVSFVYGNVSMSNPNVTREMVREVALAELPDKSKLTQMQRGRR